MEEKTYASVEKKKAQDETAVQVNTFIHSV
jgi:hypothetical protein